MSKSKVYQTVFLVLYNNKLEELRNNKNDKEIQQHCYDFTEDIRLEGPTPTIIYSLANWNV